MQPTLEQINQFRDYAIQSEIISYMERFIQKYRPDISLDFEAVGLEFRRMSPGGEPVQWLENVEFLYPNGEYILMDFSINVLQVVERDEEFDEEAFYMLIEPGFQSYIKVPRDLKPPFQIVLKNSNSQNFEV